MVAFQGQQVGLRGDALDQRYHIADLRCLVAQTGNDGARALCLLDCLSGHPCSMADLLADLTDRGRQLLRARGNGLDVVRDLPHRTGGLCRLTSDVLDGLADRIEIGADRVLCFGPTMPLVHLGCDIGRELHHLDRYAVPVADRIVGCLDPNLSAALGDPPELARFEFAPRKLGPEAAISLLRPLARIHEQAVMLPADLVEPVADCLEEVGVGR